MQKYLDNRFYHLTSGTGIMVVNWPTYIERIILVASELNAVVKYYF